MSINYEKVRVKLTITFGILLILSGFLVLSYMKKVGECDLNPFVYSAKKSYDQGMEISCECSALKGNFEPFHFDRHEITIKKNFQGLQINVSEFELNP